MKVPLLLAIAVIVVEAAVLQPKSLLLVYREVYPSDPAKRQALDLCILEDANFNRLNAVERDACYRHGRGGVIVADAAAWTAIPPNQILLRQAAYRGSVPRDDIRISLQTQR